MFAWVSLGVVLVSTFTFVLGTFPEFQKEEDTGQPPPYPEAVLVMEVVGMFLPGRFRWEWATELQV